MSWHPQDIVRDHVNVFLDFYTQGGAEDVIWSRPTEYEFLPSGTKTDHDAGMINKVSRLHDDSPLLPVISQILQHLPPEQYNAILALYHYVGLNAETACERWSDGQSYTDQDRAKKVGQSEGEFRDNYVAAKKEIYRRLTLGRRNAEGIQRQKCV